jgi:SAM-dependent methyltransferase
LGMMQNNFYDNEIFFEGYKEIRENQNNYNDLLEQPAMHDFLPVLTEKTVLDLGCGYGRNSLEFIKLGAKSVLAIDISFKMLEVANNRSFDEKITYRQLDMADIGTINQKFDFVYSSLAFHYIEDFDKLVTNIASLLNTNGILLFSQEHPIMTATIDGQFCWNKNQNGEEVSFTFSNYNQPGIRKSHWFIDDVITYHRTTGEIVTTLANKFFFIEALYETAPKQFALEKFPPIKKELLKPNFLIIRAKKL